MRFTILDCYTDEPAGLGVPPYIGTYPRYIAGAILEAKHEVFYLTIDDLRFYDLQKDKLKLKKVLKDDERKTNIRIKNRTKNDAGNVLKSTDVLIVVAGVHTPGKYLSALPGSLYEVTNLIKDIPCKKILTGPAATEFGSRLEGGKFAEKASLEIFDEVIPDYVHDFNEIAIASVKGAEIVKGIPYQIIFHTYCRKKK